MIAHIFSLLPKAEYESYIAAEKKDLKNMTLREMKKSILAHWKLFIKEDSDKKEDAFYGEHRKDRKEPFNPKKRFKGDCRKCGKQGHKVADCHGNANPGECKGKGGGKDNSNMTCYKCT